MKTKISRKLSVLALLIVGLVFVASNNSTCVDATTCADAFNNYINANGTYEAARLSFFNGTPFTCEQLCPGPNPKPCQHNCQVTRQTALANAEIGLLNNAQDTCTPQTPDECNEARLMAQQCALTYDYLSYSDLDERLAVYTQYAACREASKVDTCQ